MARYNRDAPIPGTENQESVQSKWQRHEEMKRKKNKDKEFLPMSTVYNTGGPTAPTSPKPKPDTKDKGGNKGGNGGNGNKGNNSGSGGKGLGGKGSGGTAAPRR